MIDYTSKEVRAKLYREREDISEFGIDDIHNLTCHMFHSFQLRRAVNLKNEAECVLDSFNNAFYILTIIQKEKRPEQFMGQYIEIAQSIPTDNVKYKNQFTVLTIAMVINILQVLDEKYQSEYNIVHARFKDNIKWLCEQIPSIDTYELFLKEIIPKSYIKESPNLYRVNPDDFIPLAELPERVDVASLKKKIEQLNARIEELETEKAQLTKEKEELQGELRLADSKVGYEAPNYFYNIKRGENIKLSDTARDIIEYVIHLVALKPENGKLEANIKRLIGPERTVSSHFNDTKKGLIRALNDEDRFAIKTVLSKEGIDYEELLKEHL